MEKWFVNKFAGGREGQVYEQRFAWQKKFLNTRENFLSRQRMWMFRDAKASLSVDSPF
jgi:hypothetical protein